MEGYVLVALARIVFCFLCVWCVYMRVPHVALFWLLLLLLFIYIHTHTHTRYPFYCIAHQMMEDYIDSVSSLMNPGIVLDPYYNDQTTGSRSGSTSTGTMERLTLLGYMESPLRRPSVWERWSPYEVAVFEGFLGLWGKRFCTLAKRLPHKSTKDVVAFYYVWKKTQHYQRWKQTYRPDEDEIRFQAAKKHKK